MHGEVNQAQALRTLWAFAVGGDLDVLAANEGVIRRAGESDDDLRQRGIQSTRLASVGTSDRIEYNAFQAAVDVVDAQAHIRTNRQDVDLWTLKADQTELTAADQETLRAYVNRSDQIIMGSTIHIAAVTKSNYNIVINVTYDSTLIDVGTLRARVTTQLRAYMKAQARLGLAIYHSAISRAAFTDGVVDAPVTTPAAALVATPGTVYIGGDITINPTAL